MMIMKVLANSRVLASLLLLSSLLLTSGCAVNPVSGQSDFVLLSEDQEIALGRENHAEIIKKYGLYKNPPLQDYVQRVGEKLAAVSHRSNLIYRFTVLDSPTVNAFALPGGYIYITRGLLAYLNNEAELAAVLGHEIGHVTARHAVRQHTTATATGILAGVLASQTGVAGAGDLFNVIGTALVRGYGREHELESDRLGAEYLARSGYDPLAMLEVIRVLKDQEVYERELAKREDREPRVYHGVFSTHPDNDARLQQVVGRARALQKQNGLNHTNRIAFLRHIEGLVYGDSEEQGILHKNRFYHGELDVTLSFPEGWRIENHPHQLVAIAPQNAGLLQVTALDLNRRLTPQQFMLRRLKLDDLQQGESFRHHGLEGYTALANADTTYGQRLARFVVVFLKDKAWVFRGVSKNASDPYRFDRLFIDTAKSFRTLTSGERGFAKAHRLHIITARASTRFAELARQSRLGTDAESQLRLLNHYYPKGEPAAGTPLKVVN
jgi:predicted Zn-dependent protease